MQISDQGKKIVLSPNEECVGGDNGNSLKQLELDLD
jgi:hypothetical protein